MSDFDLTGKICIVSGAGRGIGRGIAEALARHGAIVVLSGRTKETLDIAADAIGARARTHVADVTQEAEVIGLRDAVLARYGKIDVLVNNAGVNPIWKGIEKTSLEEWHEILETNLTGTFICCKHIGAAMERGSSVINVSSVAGHVGLVRSVPYCASKGGVEMMTKGLALDWAKRGVRVNCLAPGYVDTDLTHGLLSHETLGKPFLDHVPLGRFGTPREMGNAAVFLASDASSYVTGQSVVVDGGWTAD